MQSGCCKPPTSCNYGTTMMAQDADCYKWNNAPEMLCYECDSCKAGVLENVRRDWHKLSVLNIVMIVVLIGIYSIGCCAFRNTRRAETDYPYGQNRMSKVRPRWDFYWYTYIYICTPFNSTFSAYMLAKPKVSSFDNFTPQFNKGFDNYLNLNSRNFYYRKKEDANKL